MKTTDEAHPLTASKICDILKKDGIEAERKSICRDINTLIKHGYKIVLCADNKKGYYLAQKQKSADTNKSTKKVQVTLYYDEKSDNDVEKLFGKKLSEYSKEEMCADFSVEEDTLFSKLLEAGAFAQILFPEDIRERFAALLENAREFYNKPREKKKIDYWLL